ncbi:MAG: cell wall hydrolase [Eubacteriales bacterium]
MLLTVSAAGAEGQDALAPKFVLNAAEEAALARFCAAETEGEPYVCRLCVAAAMLNRLGDARYPDTVSGILLDAGACFAPGTSKACRRALCAVQTAAFGMDPSGGATEWARAGTARAARLHVLYSAGNMVFGR